MCWMYQPKISQQIYLCCQGEKKELEEEYKKNLWNYYKGILEAIRGGLMLFKTYFYAASGSKLDRNK